MIRRRLLRLAYLLGSLLLLAASLHAPTAYSAAGDPPSGSPAGAVYQLPLEQGRSDAAPKGSGGTGPGTGGGGGAGGAGSTASGNTPEPGESDSLYRTENNFGSSSHVPGVASTGGGEPGGGGGASGGGSATGAAIAGGAVAAESADTGNASVTAGIVLIAAIALLAAAVGILSRRLGRAKAN